MAKVSLRIYNKDIEQLIDQGRQDEAIAHCRHILQTFPKHLGTYRLLGKAYLEAKRYDEAVDVFQRVLMAVPDDFVSHVGMSIIRDDQGKLDESIWHMERAFESQPSNAAIQGELQRLFGRRDGVEPPKIRMTRGALAHMYVQGELYPQAISEIKAVLSQDSQRDDMRTLLARAFFHAGQKADASDICSQLLNRYQYSFDANRIMVELLQGSDSVDAAQVYRQRVNELDPYAAFAQGSVFNSDDVSDASVNLDRLEYKGQEVQMTPAWTETETNLTPQTMNQEPDWLQAESSAASTSEEKPAPAVQPDSDIPDFLRQAGWTESSGANAQPAFTKGASSGADLAPAEIPDWLKAMAPSESTEVTPPPAASAPATAESAAETPDWLSGLGATAAASAGQGAENIPDWLKGFSGSQPAEEAQEPESPASAQEVPSWLSSADQTAGQGTESADVPDWLKGAEETGVNMPPVSAEATSAPESKPADAPSLETLGATAQEQDDAVAWLESLAAKHGAKAEELVTDPNARSETPPAWVEQARAINESQPPARSMAEPMEESAPPAEPVAASEDETGMWLRNLGDELTPKAPEQAGPKEEPSAESADLSEWLKSLDAGAGKEAESEAAAEIPSQAESVSFSAQESAESASELPDWLAGLGKEEEAPAASAEPIPGWLKGEPEPETPPQEAVRATPLDWHPVEETRVESETILRQESIPEPAPRKAPASKSTTAKSAARSKSARRSEALSPASDSVLASAQAEMNRGDIPAAIEHYGKLIKKGRWLEEIIRDLRDALYRYPVEVSIWQALGDAYMRANRLQEALDSYTKAEELLR